MLMHGRPSCVSPTASTLTVNGLFSRVIARPARRKRSRLSRSEPRAILIATREPVSRSIAETTVLVIPSAMIASISSVPSMTSPFCGPVLSVLGGVSTDRSLPQVDQNTIEHDAAGSEANALSKLVESRTAAPLFVMIPAACGTVTASSWTRISPELNAFCSIPPAGVT